MEGLELYLSGQPYTSFFWTTLRQTDESAVIEASHHLSLAPHQAQLAQCTASIGIAGLHGCTQNHPSVRSWWREVVFAAAVASRWPQAHRENTARRHSHAEEPDACTAMCHNCAQCTFEMCI
jgi:hypothetical protein